MAQNISDTTKVAIGKVVDLAKESCPASLPPFLLR
jgi:hypothetical protein